MWINEGAAMRKQHLHKLAVVEFPGIKILEERVLLITARV